MRSVAFVVVRVWLGLLAGGLGACRSSTVRQSAQGDERPGRDSGMPTDAGQFHDPAEGGGRETSTSASESWCPEFTIADFEVENCRSCARMRFTSRGTECFVSFPLRVEEERPAPFGNQLVVRRVENDSDLVIESIALLSGDDRSTFLVPDGFFYYEVRGGVLSPIPSDDIRLVDGDAEVVLRQESGELSYAVEVRTSSLSGHCEEFTVAFFGAMAPECG